MTELTVKKAQLRVRQKRNASGYLPAWEVICVTMYSDGTVSRTVLCERDSKEAAFAVIDRDYGRKPRRYIDHFGIEHDGCPSCFEKTGRNEILYAGQKYCSVCGQAIDVGDQMASGRSIFAPGMKLRDNRREPLS